MPKPKRPTERMSATDAPPPVAPASRRHEAAIERMSATDAPPPVAPASRRHEVALALGWLAVPAIQHVGADQRMRIITGEPAPLEWLALVDLTVAYLALLLATVAYAVVGFMRRRSEGTQP